MPPDKFGAWVDARKLSPLRCIVGRDAGYWFLWMRYGDVLAGPNCPRGMKQAALNPEKIHTHIRIAAMGANDTWILIWEDGSMIAVLNEEYPDLAKKLTSHHGSGGLNGEDITWIALNPFRAGDYFLYVDKEKRASFQVSMAFGDDLQDVLRSRGITTTDVILRREEITKLPQSLCSMMRDTDIVDAVHSSIEVDIGALANALVWIAKTGVTIITASATCNVM